MAQCEQKGCTDTAAVEVEFDDPEETVEYCARCGAFQFRTNDGQTMERL